MCSSRRVLRHLGAAVVLFACTLVLAGPRPALALDGLAVTSATTYRLDPTAAVVHARTELGFTNTTVDVDEDGVVKRRFFTAFTFPVPVGATAPAAVAADGTALAVTSQPIEGNASFFTYSVDFAAPLYAGEHLDIVFTYDIAGQPPRTPDPSRVNPAYVAFTAYGVGDPGQASIRVEVPTGYDIDTIGSAAQVTTASDGGAVYTADAIAQPDQYALFVSARADDLLASTPVTVGDAGFDVRSWPGDAEWQQFISDEVAAGVPLMADLIGQPWPIADTVTVREAYTPYLYGYAGWFSAADSELEIGEDLDAQVVLHELSHAWFSTSWFDDRWVNEGLAQTYAAAALTATGRTAAPAVPPAPDDPSRFSLSEWGQPDFVQGGDAVEAYGYAASYAVIQQIVDQIGLDGMRRVLAAVDTDTIAYVGDGPAEPDATATTDWRRLLDLVDELGAPTPGTGWTAEPLFAEWVVTADVLPQLTERATARAAYADLAARGAEWAPPLAVRRAMAEWNFELATAIMTTAATVLDLRDQLDAAATALGESVPDLSAEYETADDLTTVEQHLRDRIATVALVQRATDHAGDGRGVLDRVGLVGDDPAGDLDAARSALATGDDAAARAAAQRALDAYDHAASQGVQRTALAAAALVLVAMLVGAGLRRGRRARDVPVQAADT